MSFGKMYQESKYPCHYTWVNYVMLEFCMFSLRHTVSKRMYGGFFLHMCRKVTTSLLEAGLDKNYAPVLVHWDSQALRRPYVEIKLSP